MSAYWAGKMVAMAVCKGAGDVAWKVVAKTADKMAVKCVHKLVGWIADC